MPNHRPLLLGEAPARPHQTQPLAGRPATVLADALGGRVPGVDARAWLADRLHLANVLPDWPGHRDPDQPALGHAWPLDQARHHAPRLPAVTVLLGRRVADLYGLHAEPWLTWLHLGDGRHVAVCPHPSGLSRAWNDPALRALASRILREAVHLAAGEHPRDPLRPALGPAARDLLRAATRPHTRDRPPAVITGDRRRRHDVLVGKLARLGLLQPLPPTDPDGLLHLEHGHHPGHGTPATCPWPWTRQAAAVAWTATPAGRGLLGDHPRLLGEQRGAHHVDQADEHDDASRGYVETLAHALPDEPEAVDEHTQERQTLAARRRYEQRRDARAAARQLRRRAA